MDIHSKGEYPSNKLSNFAPHEFEMDGVKCGSMEGFLQSLKYRNVAKQKIICALSGKEAKNAGSKKWLWKWTHNVWWKGQRMKRNSPEFSNLIDRAYMKLSQNPSFAKALIDSGDEALKHSIGSHDPFKTILTEEEFVSQLTKTRRYLQEAIAEREKELTILPKSIENDFGKDFLFSMKRLYVAEGTLKKYESGTLKEPHDRYRSGKYEVSTVMLYTDGLYPKVVRLHKNIPTFDSGDREYDSWHDLYLVQEQNGNIHAVYCTGGYRIALIEGYAKVHKYPDELKQYFED